MSIKALYTASTGMDAQQTRINNIANNIANMNTVGFKASRESFADLLYDQVQTPGQKNATNTASPIGIQLGNGVRLVGVYKNFNIGDLNQTNRELDVAVEGDGFFKVTQDDGTTAYTRDGNLHVNASGALVNSRGLAVSPSITIPSTATSVTIAADGTVTATLAGSTAASTLGNLKVSLFSNPVGLKSLGQNLYMETDASGAASDVTPGLTGSGQLVQGFLENSNVNVAEELISLILAQRSYEANSKVMQATSEMMRQQTVA